MRGWGRVGINNMATSGKSLPQWKQDKLKKLIKEGLKQVVIAERMGVTQSFISKFKARLRREGE